MQGNIAAQPDAPEAHRLPALFTLPSFSMGTPHVPLEDKETLSAVLEKLRIHLCV